ncbi:hypothetical protein QQS21_001281 [Conoideocrella luteorostrata]|uniref:Xylanolytic transcriptional activator regulatory domain-containing protein n=1 Tax=Conoideocrella luteorostrata TaxID=1105319 RepID=A0AAJ0CZV0_9HYPO|nr:hypothetical protein QQS21_001281 [Conoideocrella luteorostrata]
MFGLNLPATAGSPNEIFIAPVGSGGPMIGEPYDGDSKPLVFGKSTAAFFTQQLSTEIEFKFGQKTMGGDSRGNGEQPDLADPSLTGRRNDALDYALPSRRTADALLGIFWNLIYPIYPFLDPLSFEKDYQAIWLGSETASEESTILATLNMVFALATSVSSHVQPEQRQESAKVFYDRARAFLDGLSWDTGSIELLSYLMLTAIYLQTLDASQRCWMVVGHAIRMAESLGFHLPNSSIYKQCPRKVELARRLWHGCVLLDRVLSMTLGRPEMITTDLSTDVHLPTDMEDDAIATLLGRPIGVEGPSCLAAFYVHQLRFYKVVSDILRNVYPSNMDRHRTSADVVTILRLDNDIVAWNKNLPQGIKDSACGLVGHESLSRLAIINHVRLLHARILLFRPLLAQFCFKREGNGLESATIESLADRLVVQCSNLCLRASHQMIHVIHANLDRTTVTGPLPSWWYCVLYVYTAATVLLAERLQPVIAEGVSEYSTVNSWKYAMEILQAYARVGNSARTCTAMLQTLSSHIPPASNDETINNTVTAFDGESAMSLFEYLREDAGLYGANFDTSEVLWTNSLPGSL